MLIPSRLLLLGAILFSRTSVAFAGRQADPRLPVTGPDAAAPRRGMPPPRAIGLEALDLGKMIQYTGSPQADRSVGNHPLMLGGVVHVHGIGTRARSVFKIDLKGAAERFTAVVATSSPATTRKRSQAGDGGPTCECAATGGGFPCGHALVFVHREGRAIGGSRVGIGHPFRLRHQARKIEALFLRAGAFRRAGSANDCFYHHPRVQRREVSGADD